MSVDRSCAKASQDAKLNYLSIAESKVQQRKGRQEKEEQETIDETSEFSGQIRGAAKGSGQKLNWPRLSLARPFIMGSGPSHTCRSNSSRDATVDAQVSACREAGLVTCQHQHRKRHFFRGTDPPHRVFVVRPLQVVIRVRLEA